MSQTPDPLPTLAASRVESLDVIRGFAMLGILGPNIVAFAWPSGAMFSTDVFALALEHTSAAEANTLGNEISHRVVQILFHGKMMFLFSILFGAGVVMYARKFDREDLCQGCGYDLAGLPHGSPCPECNGARRTRVKLSAGAGLWYTRCAWLLLIGLLHAFGLWYGDILVWYAVAGLGFVWWVRRWKPITQFIFGSALYLVGVGAMTGLMVLGLVMTSPSEMLGDIPGEVAAYTGSYIDALGARAFALLMMYFFLVFGFFWSVSGMMILGIALTRTGVLTGERSDRFYLWLAGVGLGAGLGLTLLTLGALEVSGADLPGFIFMGMGQTVGIPIALGYAACLILLVRRRLARPLTIALGAVGRMALSNYLLQTLICTTIFYGHGFGLFARVQYPELWLVVFGVWGVNIAFSLLWLRVFRFGPVEWLWRSLTYLRPQPMLKARGGLRHGAGGGAGAPG